jgi:N6-adenosine-specific RNA methylase IME4
MAELPSTEGGWPTILADPPWRFDNRTGKVSPEHHRLSQYATLANKDIGDLPVDKIAAANAHLYLWCPNAIIPVGLEVMRGWGFTYKTNLIWAKRLADGRLDNRGVGFYFRNVTEMLLFGVRGKLRTGAPGRIQVNMIEAAARGHSVKPEQAYDIIETCSPGPRLELFARDYRAGWATWGEESFASYLHHPH